LLKNPRTSGKISLKQIYGAKNLIKNSKYKNIYILRRKRGRICKK
jgi:hypothetical protein